METVVNNHDLFIWGCVEALEKQFQSECDSKEQISSVEINYSKTNRFQWQNEPFTSLIFSFAFAYIQLHAQLARCSPIDSTEWQTKAKQRKNVVKSRRKRMNVIKRTDFDLMAFFVLFFSSGEWKWWSSWIFQRTFTERCMSAIQQLDGDMWLEPNTVRGSYGHHRLT